MVPPILIAWASTALMARANLKASARLIRLAARNGAAMDGVRRRLRPLLGPIQLARALRRPDSRRRRRRDIAAHYDLGNELFRRMLDQTMTYSCAVFDDPDASLEQAQQSKLELVCEKLELGGRVLPILDSLFQ